AGTPGGGPRIPCRQTIGTSLRETGQSAIPARTVGRRDHAHPAARMAACLGQTMSKSSLLPEQWNMREGVAGQDRTPRSQEAMLVEFLAALLPGFFATNSGAGPKHQHS